VDREAVARQLNELMIDTMKHGGHLHSADNEAAFRAVLRHRLLPDDLALGQVYTDTAVVLKTAGDSAPLPAGTTPSSSTMPSLIAGILEAVDLHPGQRILQIGTGPGYLVALLAHLLSGGGMVVTMEIDTEMAQTAKQKLLSMGFGNIKCIGADGFNGCIDFAPYDRIIATASCNDVPRPWVDQLTIGGLMIVPLAFTQRASCYPMMVFHKEKGFLNGTIIESLPRVGFLPLYGGSVVAPVQYDQRITKLETEIDLLSKGASRSKNESQAIFLVAMLYLAQEFGGNPECTFLPSPGNVFERAFKFWEQSNKPSLEQFRFVLAPKGRQPGSFVWSFPKSDYDLYVAV
jgi:protein-L-isoaspartate(D-aspartate) O-methyltransferase